MIAFRVLAVLAVFVALAAGTGAHATGPMLVFDPSTGEMISQNRAGEPWYPASLTKLMTAYIVFGRLKTGAMTLDQDLVVSRIASSQPPGKVGLAPGAKISTDLALQSMLVYSANDMAYVLAEGAAGSVANFVREMNSEAARLGMTGSHFTNPNGWFDPRQITTARDMGILASAILQAYPERAHFFAQKTVVLGKRKLENRNLLLKQMKAADGMKTGYICNSGFNLVATATLGGRKLGVIVFGAKSGKHRADLAEMLLVDALGATTAVPQSKLTTISNMRLGSVVPADLTTTVCPWKAPVQIASTRQLGEWGISFGVYDTALKADMALRGRLLSRSGSDLRGTSGVVRMPKNAGYAAILWNLVEAESRIACSNYIKEKSPCDVISPETFAQIISQTKEPPPIPRPNPRRRREAAK